jgi:hypothetical protein
MVWDCATFNYADLLLHFAAYAYTADVKSTSNFRFYWDHKPFFKIV